MAKTQLDLALLARKALAGMVAAMIRCALPLALALMPSLLITLPCTTSQRRYHTAIVVRVRFLSMELSDGAVSLPMAQVQAGTTAYSTVHNVWQKCHHLVHRFIIQAYAAPSGLCCG